MTKLNKRTRALSRGALIKLATVSAVLMLGSLTTTSARAADCVPSCRDGFLCHQGTCIEACNPPCGEGELCTGEGQCVAAASSTAPGYTAGNAKRMNKSVLASEAAWAKGTDEYRAARTIGKNDGFTAAEAAGL